MTANDPAAPVGRAKSLQTRLLATVLGMLGIVWVVAVAFTGLHARDEIDELLDGHLAQTAALLASLNLDELRGGDFAATPRLHEYQTKVAVQVWHEGRLVVRSVDAPSNPLAPPGVVGLSTQQVQGQVWRVLSTQGRESDVTIHVGELESARGHIVLSSLRGAVWPMALALPLLALGVWWAVRGAMRPLRELGAAVAARQPHSLEPLPPNEVPREVAPLVHALNALFDRMTDLLASERRFTADAAHELRTPIAAIRMQAQVAQGANDEAGRAAALTATIQGCDRAARLVDQLLQLARLESGEGEEHLAAAGLGAGPAAEASSAEQVTVTRTLADELAPRVRERKQKLELDLPVAAGVAMPPPLAQVLLRNLMDNALRYSPDGATVRVRLTRPAPGQALVLTVEDSGPGLSPEALGRLGERFYRVLGTGQPGSGLGWSIVRRIARLHAVTIDVGMSPTLGGLCVKLFWSDENQFLVT